MESEEAQAQREWLLDYIYRTQGPEGIVIVAAAWRKEWNRRQRRAARKPSEAARASTALRMLKASEASIYPLGGQK